MPIRRLARFALTLLLATASAAVSATDLLIHNVNGYTFAPASAGNEPELVRFNQMFIRNGKVLAIDDKRIAKLTTSSTPHYNGQGRTLLPGLIDAHGHLAGLSRVAVAQIHRVQHGAQAAAQAVAVFSDTAPDSPWLLGRGWNQANWADDRYPTRADLDALNLDRPIALERVDGHALWVNTKALELAGIDNATADPAGGKIVRDETGAATGILVDNAMPLVLSKIPALSDQALDQQLQTAYAHLLSQGITGVHDAGVGGQGQKVLRRQAARGDLPIRVYAMLDGSSKSLHPWLDRGVHKSNFLRIQSVKLYADGALGSRGATLLDDYADQPGNQGLPVTAPDDLLPLFDLVHRHGFQLAVHAIGDKANRDVLDAFEQLQAKRGSSRLRHRIEHAQVIHPDDLQRLSALNLTASMQPTHATSDKLMAEKRLGMDRLTGAYAWQTLLDKGTDMAFGSDFPVESANPFFGIHAAVTRQDQNNQPVDGWRAEDAVDVKTAIRLFTLDAARAGHWEKQTGTLTPGMWADFILVDTNPFTTLPDYLWKIQVLETWVAGEPRWQAASQLPKSATR